MMADIAHRTPLAIVQEKLGGLDGVYPAERLQSLLEDTRVLGRLVEGPADALHRGERR
jgi:hypothetical protein